MREARSETSARGRSGTTRARETGTEAGATAIETAIGAAIGAAIVTATVIGAAIGIGETGIGIGTAGRGNVTERRMCAVGAAIGGRAR